MIWSPKVKIFRSVTEGACPTIVSDKNLDCQLECDIRN